MQYKKPFYITTTLPYVNSAPHIGFAMEIIRADAVARYKQAMGYDVFFSTGTDEHGVKIYNNALAQGQSPQEYVDGFSAMFRALQADLNLCSDLHFIRTTDAHHKNSAQAFWRIVDKAGYIYKNTYHAKYCIGCELEKTDSELENGLCPIHPTTPIEILDEENYFFAFSAFTQPLLDYYDAHPTFIYPASRMEEIRSFVARGLRDFPISRLATKMPWGIPVPTDATQVMYVWFDALVNYISTIGWPDDARQVERFWEQAETVQYAGKDNLRQQTAMWQAMLMAAGMSPTHTVCINGFIISDGKKMSKSLGNVLTPQDVISLVGVDGLRSYILHDCSPFEDADVTLTKIQDSYNGNLANGIGNLTQRVLTMAIKYDVNVELPSREAVWASDEYSDPEYHQAFETFELNRALQYVFREVKEMDTFIATEEPFKKIKVLETEAKEDIARLLLNLYVIGVLVEPLLPATGVRIQELVRSRSLPDAPLFARIVA
jgi:methionyl-tRNA synthetase